MNPTVRRLDGHLPGKYIVVTSGPGHFLNRADLRRPLDRYLGRATDDADDDLTYCPVPSDREDLADGDGSVLGAAWSNVVNNRHINAFLQVLFHIRPST
jgi:hypothetical protein